MVQPVDPLPRIDPSDVVPIWSQIEEGIRRLVASGRWPPRAPVASVREMARALRVNPATVAKAYQRLADDGFLEVRRGDGTYVASAPPALSRDEQDQRLREAAERYAVAALGAGAGREQAIEELRSAWTGLAPDTRGEKR